MKIEFRLNEDTGNLHVDGTAPCGARFDDVAIVIDPDSKKPGLQLSGALGFRAIKNILEAVEAQRERKCQQLN